MANKKEKEKVLMKNRMKKVLSLAVTLSMFAGVSAISTVTVSAAQPIEDSTKVILDYDRNNNYNAYLNATKDLGNPQGVDIFAPASSATYFVGENEAEAANYSAQGVAVQVLDHEGKTNVLHIPSEKTTITWKVNAPQDGKYNIYLEYMCDSKAKNIFTSNVLINEKLVFNELLKQEFRGTYKDRNEIKQDSRGDDMRPRQDMVSVWQQSGLEDHNGNYNGNFAIALNAGENTITFTTQGEPVYISGIAVKSIKPIPSYTEVKSGYEKNGYKEIKTGGIRIQTEGVCEKSSSSIYPTYDKASASTEPQSSKNIKMNIIGGTQWANPSEWIKWNFDVPETGLYKMNIKFRQNASQGLFVSRNIYIDEKIPFKELEGYKFVYGNDWQNTVLGNGKEDYLFYLEKGTHTIKMEVSMGDMANVVRVLNDSVYELNDMYKRIILISGTTPDQFRDYSFETVIPDLKKVWTNQAEILEKQVKTVEDITGSSGSIVASMSSFARDLRSLVKKPRTISARLSSYNDSISSLSSYIQAILSQSLELDYIDFLPVDEQAQKPESGGLRQFKYECGRFLNSFVQDYSLTDMSNVSKNSRVITVWVSTGRDQAQVLKDMISDLFTPETGIKVNLQLVQGSVIEATLAGKGPDIALMQATAQPVNFAIRGALVDLKTLANKYDGENGWNEIANRFSPGAITPFKFNGSVYALPETQAFDVMFYRKDVFAELGLSIPRTWDEFFKIVPVLQRNNLEVGLPDISASVAGVVQSAPANQNMFSSLVFQKGGSYYKKDLKSTAFDEEPAKEAFAELVECYTKFNFPVKYNFYNRFRSGEMPLAVQTYTQYNQLSAAAPEIDGLWDIAPLPGTISGKDENGKDLIDRSQGSTITGAIMFQKTKDKEAAWEFMKWYTGDEAQARYALDMEAIMGPAARQAVSNLQAFEDLPWTKDQKKVLRTCWQEVRGIEEVPGSYYTARGIQNAFRIAAYDYKNPYEQFALKNKDINEEIKRKYQEFGLENVDVAK
ncbi:MAG: extracellular solute-binding protein [Bacillota bacterium]|nr:extracellular solute-binding protein [Bacillota bacterium]